MTMIRKDTPGAHAVERAGGANQPTVLRVQSVGKEYKLYPTPRARLRALVTGKATHRSHWALHDVSFELQRGECIGVIGDNGAGKSTLLKLLAGTLQPSHGRIDRVGRVTAILELGAGFHPDFSGATTCTLPAASSASSVRRWHDLSPGSLSFASWVRRWTGR